MATVDLAAFSILKRIFPLAEITLYAYGTPGACSYQPGELPYEYLSVEEHAEPFLQSDVILFWGDFTHSWSYWKVDRAMVDDDKDGLRALGVERGRRSQFERYARFVFLSTMPDERVRCAIAFGGTIITNDALAELDAVYYDAYRRFFSNAGAVFFRDGLSAAKVSPFRGGEATLGCDAAFLLEDSDLNQIRGFQRSSGRAGVGVFFVRSPCRIRMMLFSRLVGKHLGEKCSWIPWLAYVPNKRRHRWPLLALGYFVRCGDTRTGDILSSLSGYRFIVTDTYHLCINAWRMGIPAVCIGEGATRSVTSLGDKKKEVLYEMYGARGFYVFVETLRSWRRFFAEARRVSDLLRNQAASSQVQQNISMHRGMALQRLSSAIHRALKGE